MPLLWDSLLAPESRNRSEREKREALRIYRLANAWLARELMNLARAAQRAAPHLSLERPLYDSVLIYGVVPELARRLGPVKLELREIDWDTRQLSDYQLRLRAGHCLKHLPRSFLPGWDQLSRDVCHGNPVVYAVDRLCPGKPDDRDDPIATRLAEISRVRLAGGSRETTYAGIWTPEF